MIKKVEGIIINEKDFSESSKIIDVLTKEYGLISILAKGVKKLKSNLRGVTMKLTYGYFHIYYKEDKLSTLIDIDIIDNLKVIKKDLTKISYVVYICELVKQVIKQPNKETNNDEIYEITIAAILKINEEFDPKVITNIVELKMLSYLGVQPIIDKCIVCGDTASIITISTDKGGFLCLQCRHNEPIISDKAIKFIRMFYYLDISKITKLNINNTIIREIDNFIDQYYDKHTGLYLRVKQNLRDMQLS